MEIKKLIPHATSVTRSAISTIAAPATAPAPSDADDQSLTWVVLTFTPKKDGKGAWEEFHFLPPPHPTPAWFSEAVQAELFRVPLAPKSLSEVTDPRGTLFHAERITKCTCVVEGDAARGEFSFLVPGLCEGSIGYLARRKGDIWSVQEFRLPEQGFVLSRNTDGLWKYKSLEEKKAPRPGPAPGIDVVEIKPGTFARGTASQAKGQPAESSRSVTFKEAFGLGRTEVTQAQYEAVMGVERNRSRVKGPDLPVTNVTWYEAAEFCEKLTSMCRKAGRLKPNQAYRLPSEDEWEYACRAGAQGAYCCPDGEIGDYAWHVKNSGNRAQPVAKKKHNAWGLYDMHGNVAEWCQNLYRTPARRDDLKTAENRLARGGAYTEPPDSCQSASRGIYPPNSQVPWIGFRVVKTAP